MPHQEKKTLWAVSDLHAAVRLNRDRINQLQPESPADWLIIAGDIAERTELVLAVLAQLKQRFHTIIWTPGNHELFSRSTDRHRGRDKYQELVEGSRNLGVLTPEDPYPVFNGVTICPLFTLYDYSFRQEGLSVDAALRQAEQAKVVLTDYFSIAPFVDVRAWCWDRLAYSVKRLGRVNGPTILVNHWPLIKEPTERVFHPEIPLWCGTRHTRGWAQRYNAQAVIYGHLHIPRIDIYDEVPHIEVSLGYPREWQTRKSNMPWPYPVLTEGMNS
ncbi:metallophosphoesterase [Corynebacterium poyangense]|uniref:Metallophosphoesterase n=1 Tax=Corynebacterium poyangense TaxID=2684405 RepID=A0A7H0SPG1_9CORY|nr:metallophosphoesterase [Corynebacterium poyangense]MBZ8178016.1 metallophosphoesterase [Corynebacterium poyangense]QNQ90436.1 metallophosphoesterase [Corynebacterium poyangense]